MRGVRWIQQQAFPRHRAMARRPKRCLVEVDGSSGLLKLCQWLKVIPGIMNYGIIAGKEGEPGKE